MSFRFLTTAILCLALTGCILQSKEAVFLDEQGELMLGVYGNRFATYSLDGGVWKKEEGTISVTPENNHYVIAESTVAVVITFAAISGSWWAMQAQEAGKPVSYSLISAGKDELLLYPLNCGPLRLSGKFNAYISFDGEDCTVKAGADTGAMFKALAAEPGQSRMKLVPLPR